MGDWRKQNALLGESKITSPRKNLIWISYVHIGLTLCGLVNAKIYMYVIVNF